jgi:bis(5'-nucleosyl)-tetraphosphatase (symmetrical)
MATYAIGDVQGCWRTLERLLRRVGFDPGPDRLWLAGDLANRGPRNLEVLRYVRDLGDAARAVLGNHGLHLLAIERGLRRLKGKDTLSDVLEAPDRAELLEWLRQRPLLVREGGWVMVHAGLLPGWSLEQAEGRAREAEAWLGGSRLDDALRAFASKEPLEGARGRVREALVAFTLLRCLRDGEPALAYSGPPHAAPKGLVAWHAARPAEPGVTVVCGHWAAQGFVQRPGLLALDSGCVWGNALTAVRLEDGEVFQEPNAE